jgi:hypothetical protein
MSRPSNDGANAGAHADDSVPMFHDYTLRSDFER